jgi:hypothetical protein
VFEVHGSVEVEVDGTAAAVTAVLLTAVVAVLGDEVQGLRFPQSAEPKMVTTPSPSTAIRILIPNGIRAQSILHNTLRSIREFFFANISHFA